MTEKITITNHYHEHAIEMNDLDSATETLVSVFINANADKGSIENLACAAAKKQFDFIAAGNTVEYNYHGLTGRSMVVVKTKEVVGEYADGYSENDFYKMNG